MHVWHWHAANATTSGPSIPSVVQVWTQKVRCCSGKSSGKCCAGHWHAAIEADGRSACPGGGHWHKPARSNQKHSRVDNDDKEDEFPGLRLAGGWGGMGCCFFWVPCKTWYSRPYGDASGLLSVCAVSPACLFSTNSVFTWRRCIMYIAGNKRSTLVKGHRNRVASDGILFCYMAWSMLQKCLRLPLPNPGFDKPASMATAFGKYAHRHLIPPPPTSFHSHLRPLPFLPIVQKCQQSTHILAQQFIVT